MTSVGILPLRKGSKGILYKNRKPIAGKPLFQWMLNAAEASMLNKIVVFTDDTVIEDMVNADYAESSKIEVMRRSAESATDTASTEQAMQECVNRLKQSYDCICLLQGTSPLTTPTDINNVLLKIETENYDSALTVVRTHRFIWNEDGTAENYDIFNRPRRQDFKGLLVENGAVYATKASAFKESKNRISGKIALVEMPEDTLTEIDNITDWIIVEQLLKQRK